MTTEGDDMVSVGICLTKSFARSMFVHTSTLASSGRPYEKDLERER